MEWKSEGVGSKPVALISPSGFGKSEFLSQFKTEIHRELGQRADTIQQLPRWLLLLELGNEEHTNLSDEWPLDLISKHIEKVQSSRIQLRGDAAFTVRQAPYLSAGMIYVVLDGLDDYATQPNSDVRGLLHKCCKISDQGVHLIVSSRKWFWDEKVDTELVDRFSVAEILGFSEKEAQKFLGSAIKLPKGAGVYVREREERIDSPLFLKYIKETITPLSATATKADIYDTLKSSLVPRILLVFASFNVCLVAESTDLEPLVRTVPATFDADSGISRRPAPTRFANHRRCGRVLLVTAPDPGRHTG